MNIGNTSKTTSKKEWIIFIKKNNPFYTLFCVYYLFITILSVVIRTKKQSTSEDLRSIATSNYSKKTADYNKI